MTLARLTEFQEGVAIVAGGSGGIGGAICADLAASGANVALTYRSNQKAGEAVAQLIRDQGREAIAAPVDLQDPKAVQAFVDAAVERHGRLHSVVYAAGPPITMNYINALDPETWAKATRADIEGCFNLVWATLPHLRRQGGGSIVAVITAAVDRPPPKDILSAAPKAAIQALMRGLAREEGRSGIRANCVGPGWIDAGLGSAVLGDPAQAEYIERFTAGIPLKRVGAAEEVAQAVTFLLSDKARYITGTTVAVAGGLQL
jgi:NAD(P)-dependent dehydrogenase (short-subunit alcohol dehydrogenase family)